VDDVSKPDVLITGLHMRREWISGANPRSTSQTAC